MKIEILANSNPSLDYLVYNFEENKPIPCPNAFINPNNWDDNDLQKLLEPQQFEQFEKGKYSFNIPVWKVGLLTNGFRNYYSTTQKEKLLFLSQWDK